MTCIKTKNSEKRTEDNRGDVLNLGEMKEIMEENICLDQKIEMC